MGDTTAGVVRRCYSCQPAGVPRRHCSSRQLGALYEEKSSEVTSLYPDSKASFKKVGFTVSDSVSVRGLAGHNPRAPQQAAPPAGSASLRVFSQICDKSPEAAYVLSCVGAAANDEMRNCCWAASCHAPRSAPASQCVCGSVVRLAPRRSRPSLGRKGRRKGLRNPRVPSASD